MTEQRSKCVEREVRGVDVARERECFEVIGKRHDERRTRRPGFRNRTSRFVANRRVCAAARDVSRHFTPVRDEILRLRFPAPPPNLLWNSHVFARTPGAIAKLRLGEQLLGFRS